MKQKDEIFNSPLDDMVDFKFDEKVANVFEDMIQRSIPGYSLIISMIGMFTKLYAKPNTNCYDLGSSLGASALSMRRNIVGENIKIIAVDNSEAMIKRSEEIFRKDKSDVRVEFINNGIDNVEIVDASVVILNFTMQFIPLAKRQTLLEKIYNGLIKGGVLILSEKISFEDADLEARQIKHYYDFKRLNGYSDLEISRKREALENVLVPETINDHFARINAAGFTTCELWYQTFNFASMIAKK
ncbi:MAG: carboxy-S-adenosyl-L-methionine synthase CmoA [Melioribacteraceae bacterium]|nr:carboxy-S-adenosyl-L-methionine synthase CmoA [Melioribacteraceae bacterium]MCF8263055.1 carboxy-S-adenosyl-L-methionine synthase CmoA [Melioribacteraceae bacterium]MCF8413852.1 carboxy-S-adenosyl-L-methionine synthase CmoA [Melioribacteraceae bacterium]MCF8431253.1 carboxy-S-adenosyl-L-methionine synthase CmoA [Melioribacteraceae bacterium]